jgi:Dimethlysulfonioproprionate lyase
MNSSESYTEMLALTHRLLESFAAPVLKEFLADWPASAGSYRTAPQGAALLPALRWLPHIAADAASFGAALVNALCRAAPSLAWRQTYSAEEVGTRFLDNYAWTELLGPRAGETRAQIACGVLLLGPNTLYPPHRHEAEEIYVPLSGTAGWQQRDAIWRLHAPGTLIHHRSEESHAMRTDAEPLLALYLWHSADLSQRARLQRGGAAPHGAR